jgi:hypothetical protein
LRDQANFCLEGSSEFILDQSVCCEAEIAPKTNKNGQNTRLKKGNLFLPVIFGFISDANFNLMAFGSAFCACLRILVIFIESGLLFLVVLIIFGVFLRGFEEFE